mmetsp:Transcript_12284/g.26560  ORF Transcript_12284/g.26560 Transcript_12284/m.26560 type:complete len:313 (-) Transcript_12284:780-1718(-)
MRQDPHRQRPHGGDRRPRGHHQRPGDHGPQGRRERGQPPPGLRGGPGEEPGHHLHGRARFHRPQARPGPGRDREAHRVTIADAHGLPQAQLQRHRHRGHQPSQRHRVGVASTRPVRPRAGDRHPRRGREARDTPDQDEGHEDRPGRGSVPDREGHARLHRRRPAAAHVGGGAGVHPIQHRRHGRGQRGAHPRRDPGPDGRHQRPLHARPERVRSVHAPREQGRGPRRQVGGHRRPRGHQARPAGDGPLSHRAPRPLREVRHGGVAGRALLRPAGVRQDAHGQGHRQRVRRQLHLREGSRAPQRVVRRVRGQR